MSTESSQTIYTVAINGVYATAAGQFTSNDNWTDETAAAVAAALNSVTWPAGNSVSVTKQVVEQTMYTTDLATTPPTFT